MLSMSRMVLLTVTFACSAVSANAVVFTGGPGDGHAVARAARVTLDGLNAGARFTGGNADGFSSVDFLSVPSSSIRQWKQYEQNLQPAR